MWRIPLLQRRQRSKESNNNNSKQEEGVVNRRPNTPAEGSLRVWCPQKMTVRRKKTRMGTDSNVLDASNNDVYSLMG
jgi:hypothetical protein